MKKISLEIQWAIGKKTGVGWYIYNIVRELNKSKKNEYVAEFINFFGKYNVRKEIDCDIKIKENKLMSYKIYDFLTKKIKISHNFIFGTKSDIYHFFNFFYFLPFFSNYFFCFFFFPKNFCYFLKILKYILY